MCRCQLRASVEVTRVSEFGVLAEVTYACMQRSRARGVLYACTQGSVARSGRSKSCECSRKSLTQVHTRICKLYVHAKVNCACTWKSPKSSYGDQTRTHAYDYPHAPHKDVSSFACTYNKHTRAPYFISRPAIVASQESFSRAQRSQFILSLAFPSRSRRDFARKSLPRAHKKSLDPKIVITFSS